MRLARGTPAASNTADLGNVEPPNHNEVEQIVDARRSEIATRVDR